MFGRATAQMRRKSEVLPACSEHFNQGEICGKGSRDDKEWGGTGISLTVGCPLPGFIRKFFSLFTDVPKILLPTLILKTCPEHKIFLLLLCYLLSCDYENINGSES